MLICLISDIHGNLPALEIVLKQTKAVDLYLSLGDVVNYAPWSNECVDLLDILDNKILLLGNHEENFLKRKYAGNNPIAKSFHDFCIKSFNRFEAIGQYQKEFKIEGYHIIHTIDNKIIFADSDITLSQNSIVGHSHKQYLCEKQNFKLINPGSVGQNRSFINIINYMIWDTEKNDFQCFSIKYNVQFVIDKMIEMNYPENCINYYHKKQKA